MSFSKAPRRVSFAYPTPLPSSIQLRSLSGAREPSSWAPSPSVARVSPASPSTRATPTSAQASQGSPSTARVGFAYPSPPSPFSLPPLLRGPMGSRATPSSCSGLADGSGRGGPRSPSSRRRSPGVARVSLAYPDTLEGGQGGGSKATPSAPAGQPGTGRGGVAGLGSHVLLTSFNDVSNWARLSSLWPLMYGTSCCFIEFAALIGSRFDFDRYGLVPRSSPRQADLIITAGTVTMKMAPSLVRLYEQMPEPKYVIAMGACTITGGMFSTDSYTTVRGVDKLVPVDVYLPGCPPRPEAIVDAVIKLRRRVGQEARGTQQKNQQVHRYHTLRHRLRKEPPVHTGRYLRAPSRSLPPPGLFHPQPMRP